MPPFTFPLRVLCNKDTLWVQNGACVMNFVFPCWTDSRVDWLLQSHLSCWQHRLTSVTYGAITLEVTCVAPHHVDSSSPSKSATEAKRFHTHHISHMWWFCQVLPELVQVSKRGAGVKTSFQISFRCCRGGHMQEVADFHFSCHLQVLVSCVYDKTIAGDIWVDHIFSLHCDGD